MNARILFIVLFAGLVFPAVAQNRFQEAVQQLLGQPDYEHASIGISIVDLNTGENVYDLDADRLHIPASIMKLVTSAAALEILGADYRFQTKIGYVGRIKNNTLNGDLTIIGGGDPALGSGYFQDHYFSAHFLDVWVEQIKAAGILKINGDLVLDGSIYDSERVPASWVWGDIGNYYGAGPNAFSVYDNLFRITFKSPNRAGELTRIVSTNPKIQGMQITNEVLSSDINSDQAYVFGGPMDKNRTIRGTIPKGRNAFTIKAAIHRPEEVLAQDLMARLAKQGVFFTGEIKFKKTKHGGFQAVYIQESPALAKIVEVLNHESVNLFAEHLVRQIAAEKTGVGNREKGIEIIKEFWQTKGVDAETFFMEDGSGLSHFNAISPAHLTAILSFMSGKEESKTAFFNSLPAAGEGTLARFSTQYFPGNSLKAKSGSMQRVRCYAGFLQCGSGKTLAFSFMFNHFSGSHSQLIGEIETLLLLLKQTY